MGSKREPEQPAEGAEPAEKVARRLTKKDQIISLWNAGIEEVTDLASITKTRAGYVASVLQDAGLMTGYFDLYTPSDQPMNAYSKFFANRLGFKDEETARTSLGVIDTFYRQFEMAEDRAGQHHALVMALTMYDRARWTGKQPEAEVFRRWLLDRLQEQPAPAAAAQPTPAAAPPAAVEVPRPRRKKKE